MSFGGGFYAFPGGRCEAADARLEVLGASAGDAAFRASAIRELFEETGLLLARGGSTLAPQNLREMRRALLNNTASFMELLRERGLALSAPELHDAGRWITPEFLPRRFDARFFLVEAPASGEVEQWPGENAEISWVRPAEALARWERGRALLHPPTLHALRVLSAFQSIEDAASKMREAPDCVDFIAQRIEFQRGICVVPMRTPTLPPATHTNCYVLGNQELLLVDPGSEEPEELSRLISFIELRRAEGAQLKAIVLTHHHRDHIGGAAQLKRSLNIPLWCHPLTAQRLSISADRLLGEDEIITLNGAPPMSFRVLHTPGHARGHLTLVEANSQAAIVGDMVAGVGTILIDPPEGEMAVYLAQLDRLRQLPVGTLYPAHGPPTPDGPQKLTEYLEHRMFRERKVLASIGPAGASLQQIVQLAYDDVSPLAAAIAARSTEAILIKLVGDGKVIRSRDLFLRAGPPDPTSR
jgi:glyoxylase-like metal-dependent hydrolase (beta-lactamase superfamily II)/8-oxo-dGTP pyrophosphatase MutT (NUDIX family)